MSVSGESNRKNYNGILLIPKTAFENWLLHQYKKKQERHIQKWHGVLNSSSEYIINSRTLFMSDLCFEWKFSLEL